MGSGVRGVVNLAVALLLVLTFWTGTAAHALEPLDCETPAAAQLSADYDQEEPAKQSDQGAMHHHTSCHGHHVEVPDDDAGTLTPESGATLLRARNPVRPSGAGPGSHLRPPIA